MKISLYNVAYHFRLAFQGVVRNGLMSLAAVVVLASSLLVTGCTWTLMVNANYNLQEINEYNKIVVFIEKKTEDHTVSLLKEKIEAIDSVKSVEWITKDEVLHSLFEEYGDYSDILEMYNADNPCKDELVITYTDASKVDSIVYKIENMNEQEETLGSVAKINDRKDVAKKIDSIKNIASLIFMWLMILLFVVSVFIIMNTIKLAVFSRREEISIMRYLGASRSFVAFPFILEGIFFGTIAAAISFGLQYYIYRVFAVNILGGSGIVSVLPFQTLAGTLAIGFAAIGVGLGVVGSLISLRKYNKA